MESTACRLLKTPQACCHPWTNWMSVQQHQFRHGYDFSNLYTSIPHNLLKSRITALIHNNINNKKRSHTQLDSRKQVIAFQDRVITINIKEAQHPLK